MRWQIPPQPIWLKLGGLVLLVQAVVLFALLWFALARMHAVYRAQEFAPLERLAAQRAPDYLDAMVRSDASRMEAMAQRDAGLVGGRVVVFDRHGRIRADSSPDEFAVSMPTLGTRERLTIDDLDGEPWAAAWHREWRDDQAVLVVAMRSIASLDAGLRSVTSELIAVSAVSLLIMALLASVVLYRVSETLMKLAGGASRFASGQLEHRVEVSPGLEIGMLGRALNSMAEQLEGRLGDLRTERSEQEAVFESMQGGVLVLDGAGVIVKANRAAFRMIGSSGGALVGRHWRDAVRGEELRSFLETALAEGRSLSGEVELGEEPEALVTRAIASPLNDPLGISGMIVLLTDVTRLKMLERVRSDFASNVSHELRTPITSIRGYVETLKEIDADERETAEQFLAVISKNAERLELIVDDLMTLTLVERVEASEGQIETTRAPLAGVVSSAVSQIEEVLASRGAQVDASACEGAEVDANQRLLEQALANLIGNAARHGGEGVRITVRGKPRTLEDGRAAVAIEVEDNGRGIAPEHLPRLFERFYRADRGRSREAGGTGLGLAIVKHIAQVHGGVVGVRSQVGAGSVFSIVLPVLE